MPKLLMFAPCDNVLVSGDVDSVSLIVMMTTVSFPKPPEDLPENAGGPMRWFIFANWAISEEDIGKSFEQRLRLVQGNKTYFDTVQAFELEKGKLHHRTIAGLNMFPIMSAGLCEIKLDLKEKDAEKWDEIAIYPMLIQHT